MDKYGIIKSKGDVTMDTNLNLNKISKEKVGDIYAGLLIASIALGFIEKGNAQEQVKQIQDAIQENSKNGTQYMSAWAFVEKFCQLSINNERLM